MPEGPICHKCGTRALPGAADGLCPRCLILEGLAPPDADADLETGAIRNPLLRYFGDYELLNEIARGGMGVVYRARQLSLGRIVAVKLLPAGPLARSDYAARFRTEAQAAASLQHPNIVAIHEIGEHEGQPYFSMDYVEGKNLADLARGEPVPTAKAAAWLRTVAEAIAYAHARGLIHRDLKPSNILIDPFGQPRITDFGLAKQLEAEADLTLTGELLGTPSFMSPEQASGRNDAVGPANDIYSLGAMLYFLLTGRPPFQAESLSETLAQVRLAEPVRPRRLNASVPLDVETICLKCLEKDPAKRYATARDLADDLGRWQDGQPIRARPAGWTEKGWRWCRRRPAIAILLSIVLLLGVGSLTLMAVASARVQKAHQAAIDRLAESRLSEVRALRLSRLPGQKRRALELLREAAASGSGRIDRLELRNEAIAWLATENAQARATHAAPEDAGEGFLQFAPDFERYALALLQGEVSIRLTDTDADIARLKSPHTNVSWLYGFTGDGSFLAAQFTDGAMGVWDAHTGRFCFESTDRFFQLLSSPPRIVMGFQKGTQTWAEVRSLPEGARLRAVPLSGSVLSAEIDPTGHYLGVVEGPSGQPPVLTVNDFPTGREIGRWPLRLNLSCSPILAWRPDGRVLAVSDKELIHLIDLDTPAQRTFSGHENVVIQLGWDRTGQRLASASWDGTLRVWDAASGRQLHEFLGGGYQVAFSPDGRRLAQVWSHSHFGCVEFEPSGVLSVLPSGLSQHRFFEVSCSPDGRLAMIGTFEGIRSWDLATRSADGVLPVGQFRSVLFAPDGRHIIGSGAGDVTRFSLALYTNADGTVVPRLGKPERLAQPIAATFATLTPNGRWLAVADTGDDAALVLDLSQPGKACHLKPHSRIHHVAVSPDGRWLATGSGTALGIKIWDIAAEKLAFELPNPVVQRHGRVRFSPDGRWLCTQGGDAAAIWEVPSWRLRATFPQAQVGGDTGPDFSPDSRWLAVPHSNRDIRLIDCATASTLAVLTPPHSGPLASLCFTPDGRELLALDEAGSLAVWSLQGIRNGLATLDLAWPDPP